MFLNPDTINSTSSTKVLEIASKFPNIITATERHKLDDEWKELQFMDPNDLPTFRDHAGNQHRKDVVTFWGNISRMVDTSQQKRFPVISKLTTSLLALPHSNADVERIFSHVTIIKTKARNSMKTKTLEALILTKLSLGCTCVTFRPGSSLCKCVNIDMYDSSSESESE